MKDRKDKTDRASQTEASETSSKDTQTKDAQAGGTQTVHAPKPQQNKAMQTERVSEQQQQRRGPTKKMIVKKSPICIVGDSMIKNTDALLRSNMSGASQECLRGAKIQDIKKKVIEKTETVENGLLVIQGGGNDLKRAGEEETVKEVVEAVKAAEAKMCVAVVGVMRRPREGERYERLRRRTNAKIQEEVLKLKLDWLKKTGSVSFIDLDPVLREGIDFLPDGVHLSETGNKRMCGRLREWVRKVYGVCRCGLNEEWMCTETRKRGQQTGKVMYEIWLFECKRMGHW
ncbi:hypothetical protein E2C01_062282 [Portunus trituberculatus]|uniref:SGNH hydrolase-type esterase domain-containing protein n=1 Tax=Portunus trituberculatus TaxID=210409 RepID=A0A5B7H7G8_PORTR|nr:hypothetical protein [Portunus trituberculatus]